MRTRLAQPISIEAECPNCGTWQKVDRDEDGLPNLKTEPCRSEDCKKHLCPGCPQFRCSGCNLIHCAEHLTRYGTEELCLLCLEGIVSKTKWTPGPWEYRTDGDREYVGYGVCCIVDKVYATVETADRGAKERKSNAQLIAAAPDLYEALFYLADRFDQVDNGYCTLCRSHRLYTNASDRKGSFGTKRPGKCENPKCKSHEIRAALALARGEA